MVGNKKKYYRIHVLFTVYILISEITLKASQPLLGVKGLPTGNFLFLSLGGARQIQDPENMGSKKTTIFLVFLGVLQEFSRKANEDGAGRRQKTNARGEGGRRRQIQKTREQKKEEAIFLVCNHPGKRMRGGRGEGEGGSDGVENTGAKKKQFFLFAWFPKNECRRVGWRGDT